MRSPQPVNHAVNSFDTSMHDTQPAVPAHQTSAPTDDSSPASPPTDCVFPPSAFQTVSPTTNTVVRFPTAQAGNQFHLSTWMNCNDGRAEIPPHFVPPDNWFWPESNIRETLRPEWQRMKRRPPHPSPLPGKMMDPVAEVRQKTAVVLSSLRELEPNGLGWRKRASLKRYRLQPYPDTVAITYTMFRDSHHGGRQDSGGFPPHRVTSQSFAGSPHNVPNHESIGPGPHYHAPPSHMTVTQGEESSARRKRLRMDSLTSSPSTHQGGLCDDEKSTDSISSHHMGLDQAHEARLSDRGYTDSGEQ